jgi:multidrug efflux pump subunit AcrB
MTSARRSPVPGAVLPSPYGGKTPQVMTHMNQNLKRPWGISPLDVLNAEPVVLPAGTAKVGKDEYDLRVDSAPRTVEAFNNLPIKQAGSTTIYMRDVATESNRFAVQTNIVPQDGRRGEQITIIRSGIASTLDVVRAVRAMRPGIATIVPPHLKISPGRSAGVHAQSGERSDSRGGDCR